MDENVNSNGMKYDPVTGEPIQDIPQQVVQPIIEQQPVPQQPVQPQMGQPGMQAGIPNMQQPVQPQMVPPQSQRPPVYVQPLNQQQVGYPTMNNGQPVKYVAPQQQPKHSDETNPNAKKLLVSAIIAFVAGHVIPYLGTSIGTGLSDTGDTIGTAVAGFGSMVYIASIILMIILRVKYPKNQGGKILMYVMLVEIALGIITVILVVVACYAMMEAFGCYGFLI